MSRFSQAISEGDGISVVPVLSDAVAELARAAEAAGAEAIAVPRLDEVAAARAEGGLPVLVREVVRDPRGLSEAKAAGADACVLVFRELAEDEELLEDLHAQALELGLSCALEVGNEEELAEALDRLDPEIILISERDLERGEEDLERTLDLLPDVPAGKLVISESRVVVREQVVALERAGVDAVLVSDIARGPGFAAALEELVHGSGSHL